MVHNYLSLKLVDNSPFQAQDVSGKTSEITTGTQTVLLNTTATLSSKTSRNETKRYKTVKLDGAATDTETKKPQKT